MPCLRATGTMSRSASRLNRDHSIYRQQGQVSHDKLMSALTEQVRSVAGTRKCRTALPSRFCSLHISSCGINSCCIFIRVSSPACSVYPHTDSKTQFAKLTAAGHMDGRNH